MQNLEQIRARHVLEFANKNGGVAGQEGGEVIKKIPPLVMNNGLLATMAYSFSEKKVAWKLVFDAVAVHLASPEIAIVDKSVKDRQGLMAFLVGETTTSETLKRATSETMAWLDYARRFVKKV